MLTIKPLLAGNAPKDFNEISYPVFASAKIDGVRALVENGIVYSRSGKPIPNRHVQKLFGHLHGFDGELAVGALNSSTLFSDTQSAVMSKYGEPNVNFAIFDNFAYRSNVFAERYEHMTILEQEELLQCPKSFVLRQYLINSKSELESFEQELLKNGYEGVMLRNPQGKYKQGRSTSTEEILLRLKRFEDAEAIIIGIEQLKRNSGMSENLAGALIVKDIKTGTEFKIGSGLTNINRKYFWENSSIGLIVKYRYFPSTQDKPRFPVFIGLRNKIDM